MSQVLAAFQVGYQLHRVRYAQDDVWSVRLNPLDVQPILDDIERALIVLSRLLNNYERSTILDLKNKIIHCNSGASFLCGKIIIDSANEATTHDAEPRQLLQQRIAQDDGVIAIKKLQEQNWKDLQTILQNVMTQEPRVAPWYEIGAHIGDLIYRAMKNQITIPVPSECLDYLYSGVGKLPAEQRERVLPFFPATYKSHSHFASQLQETYDGLCKLITKRFGGELWETPKWDKWEISHRNKRGSIRSQENSVIQIILDEFERQHWPDSIRIPDNCDGDITQAIYYFNQKRVIRLSRNGESVSWHEFTK